MSLGHRLFVCIQLIYDILLRLLPLTCILPEQRLLVALPDDINSTTIVCLDLHPNRVFVNYDWTDLAGGEDLLDASYGRIPFLRPTVSVARLEIDWNKRNVCSKCKIS